MANTDGSEAHVAIQGMGPPDWERVRAIRLRALEDAPDAFWTTLEEARATEPATWQRRLAAPESRTFLAQEAGVDVGMAVGAPHHAGSPAHAGLYGVWVAPEARGHGVGDTLIDAVVRWARQRGYVRIRLDVGDHNVPAARLYARNGFTPTGATSRFPPPRDHVVEHELALDL